MSHLAAHADVATLLTAKHEAFVAALPSLDTIPRYNNQHMDPPHGWGWVIGDGR